MGMSEQPLLKPIKKLVWWKDKWHNVEYAPVVRCKDCKHWEKETGSCTEHPTYYDHGIDWYIYDEDDFCSCGERKDNV